MFTGHYYDRSKLLKDNAGFKLSSVIYIFEQQYLKRRRKKNSCNDQTLVNKNVSKCFWGTSKISSMYIHTRTYTQSSSQFQDEY